MPRWKQCGRRSRRYGIVRSAQDQESSRQTGDTVTALPVRRRTKRSPWRAERRARDSLFLSPWIIGILAFTAIPMLATLGFSFTNLNLNQEEPLRLIGLENYADLARDSQVWQSLGITLRFAVLWLPVVIVVPLGDRVASQQRLDPRGGHFSGLVLPSLRRAIRGGRTHLADDVG